MCSKPATSAAVWCAAVRPRGRVPHMLAHRPYGGHPYRASIARPTHHRYNSSGGSRQPAAIANTRRPVLAKAQRCLVSLKLPSQTPRTTPSTSAWRSAQTMRGGQNGGGRRLLHLRRRGGSALHGVPERPRVCALALKYSLFFWTKTLKKANSHLGTSESFKTYIWVDKGALYGPVVGSQRRLLRCNCSVFLSKTAWIARYSVRKRGNRRQLYCK